MKSIVDRLLRGEVPTPAIAETLGLRLTAASDGHAVFEMDVDPARFANPMGTVHGGILCDLADAAMGVAFASTLADGESFTTLELKINFLRPVWRATLTAEGSVTQRGRNVGLVECRVTDESGRLVAKASSTCLTLRGDQATGR
ncbi:MAG TPA: PaaI family thioesterase [Gemmatimonadaceae bacterium]|nr:PaaI family thioesterase [Gemmatimonadaceae bacterium]